MAELKAETSVASMAAEMAEKWVDSMDVMAVR